MVDIVKLRAATFIPLTWLDSPRRGEETIQFQGDDRGFTPYAVNTGRSRIEQEVVIDLSRQKCLEYTDTGHSKERIEQADGSTKVRTGKADTSAITVTDIDWNNGCELVMSTEAANPLVEHAHPVSYEAQATVNADGSIRLTGNHDSFPCFEFYSQTDFGSFSILYTYDYREEGGSPFDLEGPPDYEFDVRLDES